MHALQILVDAASVLAFFVAVYIVFAYSYKIFVRLENRKLSKYPNTTPSLIMNGFLTPNEARDIQRYRETEFFAKINEFRNDFN